jgi:hypothetical protein
MPYLCKKRVTSKCYLNRQVMFLDTLSNGLEVKCTHVLIGCARHSAGHACHAGCLLSNILLCCATLLSSSFTFCMSERKSGKDLHFPAPLLELLYFPQIRCAYNAVESTPLRPQKRRKQQQTVFVPILRQYYVLSLLAFTLFI